MATAKSASYDYLIKLLLIGDSGKLIIILSLIPWREEKNLFFLLMLGRAFFFGFLFFPFNL